MEDPPSDDGDQKDKQRSCFWWFMGPGAGRHDGADWRQRERYSSALVRRRLSRCKTCAFNHRPVLCLAWWRPKRSRVSVLSARSMSADSCGC